MKILKSCIAVSVAAGLIFAFATQNQVLLSAQETGLPYPDASTPKAVDLGPLVTQAGSTPISVTLALHLRSRNEAESLMTSLHTPGNSQFHHFLSPSEFRASFGPAPADVATVISQLAAYNLTAKQTSTTTLRVTGLPANIEHAFAVNLHAYQVPAHGHARAYTFHASLGNSSVPSEMTGSVAAVVGLNSRPAFRPHNLTGSKLLRAPQGAKPAATGNPPGILTVTDFAGLYDVQPLYQRGVKGSGRTLGIVTLASFTPSDAFAYWHALGLAVDPNRIQIVNVDGGPGTPSDASGSIETTLDVEQSGGIAPEAKVIVYQAPNTDQGFVDAFAAAVDGNSADSVSTSWGFWEWFRDLSTVTDPTTGQPVDEIQAFHELFLRAAIQGQTLFASSGDSGAYDVNGDLGCNPESPLFTCNLTLSVDHPASDPAITAAGGTTLPGTQVFCLDANCTKLFQVNISSERVWGWDYLNGVCAAIGISDPIACGIFPVGSGGGVSSLFPRPDYQETMPGLRHSEQHQTYGINGKLIFNLPGNFVGRNVPDISFNADPQTGYQVYYTSDVFGFGIFAFGGGTSFVAPQLNGITALLGQSVNGRIGLLNYPLYALAHASKGYKGAQPSLRDISAGDNWFYYGRKAYGQGAGLGTLDVANFAAYLRGLSP